MSLTDVSVRCEMSPDKQIAPRPSGNIIILTLVILTEQSVETDQDLLGCFTVDLISLLRAAGRDRVWFTHSFIKESECESFSQESLPMRFEEEWGGGSDVSHPKFRN